MNPNILSDFYNHSLKENERKVRRGLKAREYRHQISELSIDVIVVFIRAKSLKQFDLIP